MKAKKKLALLLTLILIVVGLNVSIKAAAPTYCYMYCASGELLACQIEGCEFKNGYILCGGSRLYCH